MRPIKRSAFAVSAVLALGACVTGGDDGAMSATAQTAAPVGVSSDDPAAPSADDPWSHHYFTTSDGVKLHYVEWGQGTPVILIHGAGGSAVGNWFNNGMAERMVDTNRVIGIDMRGHGLSESGDRSRMASDVLEFMAQQGIEKAHIGGYSMGGGVTLSLMTSNPEKFITAHFGGSGITEIKEFRDQIPEDKTGTAPMEAKAREAYYEIQEARGQARGEETGNAARREPTEEEAAAAAARRAAMADRPAPSIDLTAIDFPVLAVNGDYDRPYAKTHRMWRQIDNFTSIVLTDYGHLSAVMAGFVPEEYSAGLEKFITANNPG